MQPLLKFNSSPLKAVPPTLDTLAQLTPNPEKDLLKKAKRKAITVFLSTKLIELNNINLPAYRNMYYCNSVIQQHGHELTTSYCKNRFCMTCNAIKTANLINGYLPELKKMRDPQFFTLTIKAVKGKYLHSAINLMQKNFRKINQHLNKYHKIKIQAIRKLECNHNPLADTYNPHYHLIIDGKDNAVLVKNMWLHLNPRSHDKGQDIRGADHNSMIELFKYATKLITKDGTLIPAKSLDIIYSAFRRRRVVQPIGIRKFVDEDKREKIIYTQLKNENALWKWDDKNYDWYNENTGELLTGFVPEEELIALFERSEVSKKENTELLE